VNPDPRPGDPVPLYQLVAGQVHGAVVGENAQVNQTFNLSADPRPASLFQLPAAVGNFTGRERDLGVFLDDSREDAPRARGAVYVISGMPGVGKTAFAVHVAHRLAARYSDAQLHIDLHGYDPGLRLSVEQVLPLFIRAFGVPTQTLPARVDEQIALYRSLLVSKRAVILLDNASSEEQVRMLLPGSSSCLVLVTSRGRLPGLVAGNGARPVVLDPLDAEESFALLANIVGSRRIADETDVAYDLADLCGRLPLALTIAAARLAVRPRMSLAELYERLKDEGRRLHELMAGDVEVLANFNLSYGQLGNDEARVFRLLSLAPGPDFSPFAAAALVDDDVEHVRGVLETLVDSHLVEQGPAPARFRMHDLIRIFARERLTADEEAPSKAAAQRRVFDWYLGMAASAEDLLIKKRIRDWRHTADGRHLLPLTTREQALSWFEEERVSLVGACREAQKSEQYETVWRIADASWGFFQLRKYWSDWEETHRLGLASAIAAGDDRAVAWMLTGLGGVQWELGHHADALDSLHRSLVLHRSHDDDMGACRALLNLSFTYGHMDNHAESVRCADGALQIADAMNDQYRMAWALYSLGTSYRHLGQLVQARASCEKALAIWRAVGDRMGEGFCLDSLGKIYRELGQLEDSRSYLETALEVRREVEDVYGEGMTLDNLARTYDKMYGRDRAVLLWTQSLEILTRLSAPEAATVSARLSDTGPV
jgi:tetratricopeptide (TPR) repeat protein